MKTILRILIVVAVAFSLISCKDTAKVENKNEVKTENTEKKDVKEEKKEEPKEEAKEEANTVTVTDITGVVEAPFKPERVVALDNRTFETLADWGIKLAAVPKDVMSSESPYVKDDSVANVGNHKEPNLEVIAAANPELIIVGQRFGKYTEELKKLCPEATVIDLNWNVSKDAENPGESLINGLKTSTITLGKIFDKNEEAEKLVAEFDKSIEEAKATYKPGEKVMAVVVNAGNIGYSAPKAGRVWGPMFEVFGWTPALEIENSSSDHKGDDVSVEAIAESNPDWMMVLDRDASVSKEGEFKPAVEVLKGSEALKNVNAIKNDNIVLAPADTYVNESIQTYIELFGEMSAKFK